MSDIVSDIRRAKKASIDLSVVGTTVKNAALTRMIHELDKNRNKILEANSLDLVAAQAMLDAGEITGSMFKRLKVDNFKIDGMIEGIRDVIALPDPVGEQMSALELDKGLVLYQIRCPIGLIGVIFESRPDVVPQIMSLCLKSGNGVAFKGGREAGNTIRVLFDVLRKAASDEGIPADAFVMMESRSDVDSIIGLNGLVNLLIPRGSNQFVQYIQSHTSIPVLGHAAGICHVYVDDKADLELAYKVVLDSKIQYPAVCNATETLLVNSAVAESFLPKMLSLFSENGVEVRGDERVVTFGNCIPASDDDWDTEYGDLIISVKVVDGMSEAIDFINVHGSHHTDAIITSDMGHAAIFAKSVDSADVFVNASTRFADGYRFGKGAEVGISTNKIHSRGPVGMEGLMIYKYVLIGHGQVVKDYVGPECKKFTHVPSNEKYPFGDE